MKTTRVLLLLSSVSMFLGCTTVDPEQDTLRRQLFPRWETNEAPYEDAERSEQIARNVRDGMVGFLDDYAQGAFSVFLIIPFSGYSVQKVSTMVGNVVGLIDDNEYTEHVFKGIISRQFLKFGASARDFIDDLGAIHQISIEGHQRNILHYVGDETFHTDVYLEPSAIVSLGGVVLCDFIIRPSGHIVLIFGGRELQKKIDKEGLDLLKESTHVPFL